MSYYMYRYMHLFTEMQVSIINIIILSASKDIIDYKLS